jgi:hypothetical protein
MESLFSELAKSGPFGVITALAIWYAWMKDKQLRELYESTLKRVETMNERYHTALGETATTIRALTEYETDSSNEESRP